MGESRSRRKLRVVCGGEIDRGPKEDRDSGDREGRESVNDEDGGHGKGNEAADDMLTTRESSRSERDEDGVEITGENGENPGREGTARLTGWNCGAKEMFMKNLEHMSRPRRGCDGSQPERI